MYSWLRFDKKSSNCRNTLRSKMPIVDGEKYQDISP